MKVFGSLRSRAFRAVWALEEAGLAYERVDVDPRKGEARTPEFLSINPAGKVPALQDGSLNLFESGAICTYIAEKVPERRLIPPAGTPERGLYFQWSFFVTAELEQGLWTMAKHNFALPAERRVEKMQEVGAWEFARAARVLEVGLKGREYLAGETFTMADLLAGHTLLWAKHFDVPLGSERLETYLNALTRREAYRRATGRR